MPDDNSKSESQEKSRSHDDRPYSISQGL